MVDYIKKDNKLKNDFLIIAEELDCELNKLKIDRITDKELNRYLDFFISQISKLIRLYNINPRFCWVDIQKEIDRLYNEDKSINGIIIFIDWFEGKNRGCLRIKIN
jgi:hypothetical protein